MQICRVPGAIANKYDDRDWRIGDFIVLQSVFEVCAFVSCPYTWSCADNTGNIPLDLCHTPFSSDSSCFSANDNLCCSLDTWSNLASCPDNCSIPEVASSSGYSSIAPACDGRQFCFGNGIRTRTALEKERVYFIIRKNSRLAAYFRMSIIILKKRRQWR